MTSAAAEAAPAETRRALELSGETIAWAVAGALFFGLRLGTVWHAAVGGAELDHLAGAWQARIGQTDDRYVPTLFQALASLLLHFDATETWPRVVSLVSVSSVPFALYLLRPRLGRGGALVALLLLALDAPLISLGTSASAMGFDVAITVWLFVALTRPSLPSWVPPLLGFLVITAGPLALPLVAAAIAVRALRHEYPERTTALLCLGGVAVGVLVASFRFALGPSGGVRVPALDLLASSMTEMWSTANTFQVALLYSLPVILGGVAAAVVAARRLYAQREAATDGLILIVWAAVALLWFVVSGTSHSLAPIVALTLPLSLVLGPALVEATTAMVRADWAYARFLIPGAIFAALVAVSFALDWAHNLKLGDGQEQLLVAGLCLAAVSALGGVLSNRDAHPSLFAAVFAVAAFPVLSGAFGVGFGSGGEPIPSPVSTTQARQLRGTALEMVAAQGGSIVVHPDLQQDITWPFRDSGKIVIASRPPADATVVIWPSGAAPPEGFSPLTGDWALLREPQAPVSDFLDYLHWFTDRNALTNTSAPIAVYVRAKQ